MNKPLLILLALSAISCNNPMNQADKDEHKANKKVEEPTNTKVHEVPADLNEISGISFLSDNIIAAVQDEDGILYYYDLKKGKIIKEQKFAEPDDFEDLAKAGNDMYTISSNGNLYQLKNFESSNPQIQSFKTGLTGKNNIEGLTFDARNNRLLLAAKDKGLDNNEDIKEIYAFNLKTMQLQTDPIYSIRLDEIESYFKGDALEESSKKFLKAIGNQNMNKVFRSSALTINPKTNEVFVLSSINNMIIILSPDGKIKKVIKLDGPEYQQPEGIAFSPAGKLYVSNERGKGSSGNIIQIEYAN